MAKKKVVENYEDIFKELQESQKEVEELVKEASAKEEVVELPKGVVEVAKQSYYAYGVFKNKDNRWEVVEIIYQPETGQSRINDTLYTSSSKASAQVHAEEFIARRLSGLSIPQKQKRGT